MRVAILIKKAEAEQTPMPEDVAFFIAKNVRANVRELEGALRKVLAYSRFSHKEINIQLAREALKDLLSIQNRQISVENIQKTVADYYKIRPSEMHSEEAVGAASQGRARWRCTLAKELTQLSAARDRRATSADATTRRCSTPCRQDREAAREPPGNEHTSVNFSCSRCCEVDA